MLPTAAAVVAVAISLLSLPRIPYVLGGESLSGMDCEGLVQYCVIDAGGNSRFKGSNDMFRHDVSWVGTLEQAQNENRLVPGAALFVVAHDGKEPAEYQGDGMGNAHHVALYAGAAEDQVVSASAVKGYVVGETMDPTYWTHVGWLKDVDYSAYDEPLHPEPNPTRPPPAASIASPSPTPGPIEPALPPASPTRSPMPTPTASRPANKLPSSITVIGPGRVRMHLTASLSGEYMGAIPVGDSAEVISSDVNSEGTWFKIRYKEFPEWWILEGEYLSLSFD